MKPSDFFESLGLRFPAMPRLQPAGGGAPLQFSATGGGGGGYDDDPDDEFYDEYEEEPAPRRRAEETRQPTAARRRTVQSEPDDRYWTDYLRIALPVIGLLLVIAVFWFWAQQLIDDPEDDLTPTETPGLAEVIESPTQEAPVQEEVVATPPEQQQQPQSTQAPVVTPTPVTADQPAETVVAEAAAGEADAGAEATEPPAEDAAAGGIAPDMTVVVTEDVNLRSDPTTAEENVVTVLSAGTELTVLSGPEEGENYVWWQVVDNTTGDQGWVVQEFIEPAG